MDQFKQPIDDTEALILYMSKPSDIIRLRF